MIVVHVTLRTNEKNRPATIEALRQLQDNTRKKDRGCLAYNFSADLDDANTFYCTEEWTSMGALETHLASDHMAQSDATLEKLLTSKADVSVFTAQKAHIPQP
ncbi:putative quinol monooxygenase [Natronoglycomyces albus]|uniref:Antibiotic biosynthesis monooxygenase n=1 Tax=Natronoglycomyces albus TaxID=2811108 RepID=A0A895XU15_9ACTN|nr:putative quinol monooxygenase [Natronoglycomyces albus]QSB06789.1 antibiotic biosynthesis monooxygenase [Natronoglycomyces albus]